MWHPSHEIVSSAWHEDKNISKLRPALTMSDAEKLVHAWISSRLDYCKSRLHTSVEHMESVAARNFLWKHILLSLFFFVHYVIK